MHWDDRLGNRLTLAQGQAKGQDAGVIDETRAKFWAVSRADDFFILVRAGLDDAYISIDVFRDMADWLDGTRVHPCNFENAYKGFEIMAALQRSAAQGGQVALPLTAPADEQALLKAALSDRTVLVSDPVNKKEFGLV